MNILDIIFRNCKGSLKNKKMNYQVESKKTLIQQRISRGFSLETKNR